MGRTERLKASAQYGSESNCNHDLRLFWVGHKLQSMDERYSKVCENVAFRLKHAEDVGLGFEVKEGKGTKWRNYSKHFPRKQAESLEV